MSALQQNIHILPPCCGYGLIYLPPRRRRAFRIFPFPKHSLPSKTFSGPVAPKPGHSISGTVGWRADPSAEQSRLRESTKQPVNYALKPSDACVRAPQRVFVRAMAAAKDMRLNLAWLTNCSASRVININIYVRKRPKVTHHGRPLRTHGHVCSLGAPLVSCKGC